MTTKKSIKQYVFATYLIFIVLLLLTGIVLLLSDNQLLIGILKNVCSFAPTFSLLLLFPRLGLGKSRKEFFLSLFREKINLPNLLPYTALQIILFVISVISLKIFNGIEISETLNFSIGLLILAIVNSLTSGATGEEAGWRGFLHSYFVPKYGIIQGSFFIGVIWGFWHAPLWFISGEYTGLNLVKYIIFFLCFIISTAIIIGFAYEKNKNLMVPMALHFTVNFTMAFVNNKFLLDLLLYLAIFYVIATVVLIKIMLKKSSTSGSRHVII